MKGAIFFSGKYGSTKQYAHWIAEATGLPLLDVKDKTADPKAFDFLVLGSSILYYKPTIRHWIRAHLETIVGKPILLFTVSGAGQGKKLNKWLKASLPVGVNSQAEHIALRGRMNPAELPWGSRMLLQMAALVNPDRQARKEEREGFDYMDKTAIAPVLRWVEALKAEEAVT